jgi:VWFA-related protein
MRVLLAILILAVSSFAQPLQKEFAVAGAANLKVVNLSGRVNVFADKETKDKAFLTAVSPAQTIAEDELLITQLGNRISVEVKAQEVKKRIDLTLRVPARAAVEVKTASGEVQIAGSIAAATVQTDTGTIYTDIPLVQLDYRFMWLASSPRYLSEIDLEKVKEKTGGRFAVNGHFVDQGTLDKARIEAEKEKSEAADQSSEKADSRQSPAPNTDDRLDGGLRPPLNNADGDAGTKVKKKKSEKGKKTALAFNSTDVELMPIALDFTTERGIILLNVNPGEVPTNLRERPLSNAAKAIVRSGDSLLMSAIRLASPKYFGDYARTLPPVRIAPALGLRAAGEELEASTLRRVNVSVTDAAGRAVRDLKPGDFSIFENNQPREVISVESSVAPFNLVLLLDVSGSVEDYMDFIRKAARSFLATAREQDRIAIVMFNDDAKTLATFTTDREALSKSLDSFDAGGGTAYYDGLAYALVDTLRPLRGERTAIVALSDGDDNRSFLSFESLMGSIQESGALIYPLYVPSELVAVAKVNPNASVDTMRTKYLGLSSKAEEEGARLAAVSGGVYYPIRRLEDLQKAYDDVVVQLRTAYTITFRSELPEDISSKTGRASPRLKVKVNRENAYAKTGSVVNVGSEQK